MKWCHRLGWTKCGRGASSSLVAVLVSQRMAVKACGSAPGARAESGVVPGGGSRPGRQSSVETGAPGRSHVGPTGGGQRMPVRAVWSTVGPRRRLVEEPAVGTVRHCRCVDEASCRKPRVATTCGRKVKRVGCGLEPGLVGRGWPSGRGKTHLTSICWRDGSRRGAPRIWWTSTRRRTPPTEAHAAWRSETTPNVSRCDDHPQTPRNTLGNSRMRSAHDAGCRAVGRESFAQGATHLNETSEGRREQAQHTRSLFRANCVPPRRHVMAPRLAKRRFAHQAWPGENLEPRSHPGGGHFSGPTAWSKGGKN